MSPQTVAAHAKDLKAGDFIPGASLDDVANELFKRWQPCKGCLPEVKATVLKMYNGGRLIQGKHPKSGRDGYLVPLPPREKPRKKVSHSLIPAK